MTSDWEITLEACRRLGAGNPRALWRKEGRNSGAVTLGACVEGFSPPALVFQVYPSAAAGSNGTSEGLQRQYGFLAEMADSNQVAGCRFVRPVALFSDLSCVVSEAVAGVDMWEVCCSTCGILSRRSFAGLVASTAKLGEWAAALAARTARREDVAPILVQYRGELETKLSRTRQSGIIRDADLGHALEAYDGLAADVLRNDGCSVVAHGDLCPANVILGDGETYVIDIHTAHRGLGYEDAAYYLCTMDQLSLEWWRYSTARVSALKAAFAKAYGASAQSSAELVTLQLLRARTQMMCYYVRSAGPQRGLRHVLCLRQARHYAKEITGMCAGLRRRR